MASTLTVGLATFLDTAGSYFTISGLRANHPHVEIIVVDNAPLPDERTRDVCLAAGGRYVHAPNLYGTSAPRDEVFRLSQTPWTMCVDSHVIFETDAIASLIRYAEANPESNDIISGPLVYDNGTITTHWRQTTPPGLWGVWDTDARVTTAVDSWHYAEGEWRGNGYKDPFEIPMQGLGCWAMRTDAWPGFNPLFKGFGGEEGYIHEVVRRRGGRAMCLPSLRWRHWFRDTSPHTRKAPYQVPIPYNPQVDDHVWNLLVGHREVGIAAKSAIYKDFGHRLHPGEFDKLVSKAAQCQPWDTPGVRPAPMKILGIWYSNNAAPKKVLNASLGSIKRAADLSRADVSVVTCPWERIASNPFPEVVANFKDGPGHLNIVRQQRQCLETMKHGYPKDGEKVWRNKYGHWPDGPDVVCFLEHDVLYPPDYFDRVARAFRENPAAPVVSNLDYEGLNATGWLKVKERHEPLHQLSLRHDVALANLERCEAECLAQGWCYLEPQGDRSDWARIPPSGKMPSIHINH